MEQANNSQGDKGILGKFGTKFLITALGMVLLSLGFFFGKIDTQQWVWGLLGMVGSYDAANVGLTAMFRRFNGNNQTATPVSPAKRGYRQGAMKV